MNLKPLVVAVLSCMFTLSATAGVKEDIWKVSKEKAKLSREVSGLFRKIKIKDAELDALQEKAYKASVTFSKTRKKHPDLKDLYKVSDAAQTRMIKAMTAKDKEASKVAREEYVEARKELEKISQTIPELVELQKKAIEANDAVKVQKTKLLASTPEGKVLLDKMKALDAEIVELRKQLK